MSQINRRTCRSTALILAMAAVAVFPRPLVADDPPANPFDGLTLDGWTTLDGQPVTRGWEVVDGTIHLKKEERRAGHIVTVMEFCDFTLSFEWKVAPGGNSGLKYRVRKYGNKTLGCEFQILDDEGYRKRLSAKQMSGALYDLYEPIPGKYTRPTGEFNSSRIMVHGQRIEHWLNGTLIVSAIVGDDGWKQRIAESKFSDEERFGENRFGRLMLTDHGSEVWFRNIKFETIATRVPGVGGAE